MDDLTWLQFWFFANCDGEWEHREGIVIGTLDNPGWSLNISLEDTDVVDKEFTSVQIERGEDDWIDARVRIDTERKNKIFYAACGPQNLNEAIKIFRDWVGDDVTQQPKDEHYRRFKSSDKF